jgi:hypothetical protein
MQISTFLVETYESDRDLAAGAEDRQDKSLRRQGYLEIAALNSNV